jgi:hypothetical protein
MLGEVFSGLVLLAMVAVVLWVAFDGRALVRALRRRLRPEPRPQGPPFERIALDLRRLRSVALRPAPGTPKARRVGTMAAYDDALVDACHALGVPDELTGVPEGPDREAARLRTEALLAQAGLRIDDAA